MSSPVIPNEEATCLSLVDKGTSFLTPLRYKNVPLKDLVLGAPKNSSDKAVVTAVGLTKSVVIGLL